LNDGDLDSLEDLRESFGKIFITNKADQESLF
jgi:hypothetical protein